MIQSRHVLAFILVTSSLAAEVAKVHPAQAMGLLKTQCLGCHNAEKKKGGLSLETRELALKGGENGAAMIAGDADHSELIKALNDPGDAHMPPKKQMPEKQINLLKAWVNAGAPWDDAALKKFGELTPADKLTALPASHTPAAAMALSAAAALAALVAPVLATACSSLRVSTPVPSSAVAAMAAWMADRLASVTPVMPRASSCTLVGAAGVAMA